MGQTGESREAREKVVEVYISWLSCNLYYK